MMKMILSYAELWEWAGWVFRVSFGGYFFFQGINGFFKLWPIPEPTPQLSHFLEVFQMVPTFMTVVRIWEIVGGIFLVLDFAIGVSYLLFAPLVYGIVILQWFLNSNRRLALTLGLWFGIGALLHMDYIIGG